MRFAVSCVLILILTVAYIKSEESEPFFIKHLYSGKYVDVNAPSSSSIQTSSGVTRVRLRSHHKYILSNYWIFDRSFDHWGFIMHQDSVTFISTASGSVNPGNAEWLKFVSIKHWGSLFAIDAVNNYILHKSGKYIHHPSGRNMPSEDESLWIHQGKHDGNKFKLVYPSYDCTLQTEVLVYGVPTMIGKWKIINMVLNPIDYHVSTFTVLVGKSKLESVTSSFKYTWEVTAGAEIIALSASVSQSFQYMVKKTSSSTWYEQVTQTKTISVRQGQSVVMWQYVIEVEQNASKGVYYSDMLADTDSPNKIPDDLEYRA